MVADEPTTQTAKLGEILIRRGMITQEQLDEALEKQQREKGFVGEKLIDLGFIEERDVLVALIVQCHLPYIAVANYVIDKDVIALIDRDTAKKYCVLPLDRVSDVLSVVMADPLNEAVKEELKDKSGCTVAPFIATKAEIEQAIEKWY